MKDIFCSCSPNRFRTGLPYSSKSSSAKAPKALEKAISRLCSKPLNGSRKQGVTCRLSVNNVHGMENRTGESPQPENRVFDKLLKFIQTPGNRLRTSC